MQINTLTLFAACGTMPVDPRFCGARWKTKFVCFDMDRTPSLKVPSPQVQSGYWFQAPRKTSQKRLVLGCPALHNRRTCVQGAATHGCKQLTFRSAAPVRPQCQSIPVAILAPQEGFICGMGDRLRNPTGSNDSSINECVNDLVCELLEMLGDGEAWKQMYESIFILFLLISWIILNERFATVWQAIMQRVESLICLVLIPWVYDTRSVYDSVWLELWPLTVINGILMKVIW